MAKTTTTQPEIIEVIDDSDHDEERIPPSVAFRILGDGCLELLDDSDDDETNSRHRQRKRQKKHTPPTAPSQSIPDGGCLELLDDSDEDGSESSAAASAKGANSDKISDSTTTFKQQHRRTTHEKDSKNSKSNGNSTTIIGLRSDSDDPDNNFLYQPSVFAKPPATMNQNSSSSSQDIQQPPIATSSPKKKLKTEAGSICRTEMDDAMVVPRPLPSFCPAAATPAAATTNANDDDFELVGHTGQNALSDFPHSREHCVQKLFSVDPHLFCPNCYCVSRAWFWAKELYVYSALIDFFLSSHCVFQVCLRHSRVRVLVLAATLPCHLFQPELEQGTKEEEEGETAYRSGTPNAQQNRSYSGDSSSSSRCFVWVFIAREDFA